MNQNQMILLIVLSSLLIYLIITIKKRPATLLSFMVRSVGGLSYIYLFNSFCAVRGIATNLGINLVTIGLSAFLGVPGAILAFAINLLQITPVI
ncbi:MAG: pro-sigmaK processing inhibitor BofA family protein [Clostridiales bacterium]|nr:pro-sigmaK processing inhibitor BofA family protein [Clostridiales bacterium]